jgi:membrane protein
VLLWVVASWAFSKYVANFGSYDKTYGSIAGVIVLLLWMWLSSLVLLVGAETNAIIEHRSPEGKREGAKSMDDAGLAPRATMPPKGQPVPVGANGSAAARPAREVRVPVPAERRPRLRGVAAIAAGFGIGVLLARRQA